MKEFFDLCLGNVTKRHELRWEKLSTVSLVIHAFIRLLACATHSRAILDSYASNAICASILLSTDSCFSVISSSLWRNFETCVREMWQNDRSRAEKSSRMPRLSSTRSSDRGLLGEQCFMLLYTSKFITDIWYKIFYFQTVLQEIVFSELRGIETLSAALSQESTIALERVARATSLIHPCITNEAFKSVLSVTSVVLPHFPNTSLKIPSQRRRNHWKTAVCT